MYCGYSFFFKTKEEDKTLRRKEKQKSKDEVKQEKRRVKEEKLKKVAEDKKKQKGKTVAKSNAIITHQATFEDFVQSDTNAIPLLLEKCVNFVEEEGLDSEGIYRVPGNRAHVELLFNKFEEGKIVVFVLHFFKDIRAHAIPLDANV